MIKLSEAELCLRCHVWADMVTQPGCPQALNHPGRLVRLETQMIEDKEFWHDLLKRHNLRRRRLDALPPGLRDHAIGSFWRMLAQKAHNLGWKI